ncbi:MAG: DUF4145 domain-containing protein [Patescibacteria group bacterium]
MQKIPYRAPQFQLSAFNCPLCNAFANQVWRELEYFDGRFRQSLVGGVYASFCTNCGEHSIWYQDRMLYPVFSGVESVNQDLNDDIQRDYREASEILQRSPRGAAALLRLAVQKLCVQLGEKGENINEDIGNLVARGLPIKVQQSLDAMRVIGNEAVHPGQLDLRDDVVTASKLFKLINFIAEKLITEPREIDEIYNEKIPNDKKEQIAHRDAGQE